MNRHQCPACVAGHPEKCNGAEGHPDHFRGWTCGAAVVEEASPAPVPIVDPAQTLLDLLFGEEGLGGAPHLAK